jgi:hypothetical protein
MTDQPTLFADPVWTDRWAVGATCRDRNLGHEGVITAIDPGQRLHVRWIDHPRWGTYECSYGWDRLLERLT